MRDQSHAGARVQGCVFVASHFSLSFGSHTQVWGEPGLAHECQELAREVEAGINKYAVVKHQGKSIYAYEVGAPMPLQCKACTVDVHWLFTSALIG